MAHRIVWEIANGPIPSKQMIDHMCRNRKCVNLRHLQLATAKTNGENRDGMPGTPSGVRGVWWCKRTQRWGVTVVHNRKKYFGGRHDTLAAAESAAIALRNELYTNNLLDRAGRRGGRDGGHIEALRSLRRAGVLDDVD